MEAVFNRCWVFRDAKCGICKPKLGIYKPYWAAPTAAAMQAAMMHHPSMSNRQRSLSGASRGPSETLCPHLERLSGAIAQANTIVMKIFYLTFAISLLLIIGGFLLPPMGIIDGSVLTAVGELLMFGVLAQVPALISAAKNGKCIKLSKGDFTAEVSSSQDQRTGS